MADRSAAAPGEDPGVGSARVPGSGSVSASASGPAVAALEPIAVVGIACRLPGASSSLAFWRLLCAGEDAVADIPGRRLELAGAAGALGSAFAQESIARRGGFLEDIDMFDAAFFGVSPREAAAMDPQQRLMLELCWEALEDAGIAPRRPARQPTGVFVGAICGDYADLLHGRADRGGRRATRSPGCTASMIANRVSYTLGLRGPSLTVDTGQSSSLVAVHLACESLRRGESELALAGGVHLNISLEQRASARPGSAACRPDGRCFTFDARANGYVRGEGGGVRRAQAAVARRSPTATRSTA